MTADDELDLAREDYASEDKTSENLLKVAQFHLTIASLLGGASLAIAKGTTIRDRFDVFVIGYFFILVWVSLVQAAHRIKGALESRNWELVPSLLVFSDWRKSRQEEIAATRDFTETQAEEISTAEILEAMKTANMRAAQCNRLVNDARQR